MNDENAFGQSDEPSDMEHKPFSVIKTSSNLIDEMDTNLYILAAQAGHEIMHEEDEAEKEETIRRHKRHMNRLRFRYAGIYPQSLKSRPIPTKAPGYLYGNLFNYKDDITIGAKYKNGVMIEPATFAAIRPEPRHLERYQLKDLVEKIVKPKFPLNKNLYNFSHKYDPNVIGELHEYNHKSINYKHLTQD